MIDIKLIDGFWVIGTNKWDANFYSKEEAQKFSSTLIDCLNCINCTNCSGCRYCSYCSDCSYCRYCSDCSYCSGCRDCSYCSDCSDCSYCRDCSYCSDCSYCRDCSDCSDCSYCRYCSYCSYCSYCRDCSYCSDCSYCRDCRGCSNFKTNPQRITSPILGSRNSQTTYYWNDENEKIVCGCFKGTLEEFETKVKITHGDNDFAKGYLKWIELVKIYKGGQL